MKRVIEKQNREQKENGQITKTKKKVRRWKRRGTEEKTNTEREEYWK